MRAIERRNFDEPTDVSFISVDEPGYISPADIVPLPKAQPPKTKGGRKKFRLRYSSTPIRNEFAEQKTKKKARGKRISEKEAVTK